MHEECGVVGISFKNDLNFIENGVHSRSAAMFLYYALYGIQHRGQESAGMAVYDDSQIRTLKGMGLVPEIFNREDIQKLKGRIGIGHVRYSTTGDPKIENCQPLTVNFKGGTIAIAHNGNIVNAKELRIDLEKEGRIFISNSDTEVIAHLMAKNLMNYNLKESVRKLMEILIGSYSLIFLIDDLLIAVRDPLGIKPLCLGMLDNVYNGYIVASESVAIDILDGHFVRDISPGEMLIIKDNGYESIEIEKSNYHSHCIFEYIYFARPDSIIDSKLVYNVRMQLGKTLFEEHPTRADIVSPIPDSGITYAIGYAKASSIDYVEGLMKNRYIGRTFIMPGQDMRDTAVRLKLNVIKPNIQNKSVVLVDDSIVRGTTSRRIINLLRNSGAKEIHLRIASPPIISPCYLGIDMATRGELIAAYKTIKGIEALLDVDSLGYVSIEGLVKSIGIPLEDLCIGCLTGEYPVEIPGEKCTKKQSKLYQYNILK